MGFNAGIKSQNDSRAEPKVCLSREKMAIADSAHRLRIPASRACKTESMRATETVFPA
jgi:hypothetical protein